MAATTIDGRTDSSGRGARPSVYDRTSLLQTLAACLSNPSVWSSTSDQGTTVARLAVLRDAVRA